MALSFTVGELLDIIGSLPRDKEITVLDDDFEGVEYNFIDTDIDAEGRLVFIVREPY